MAHRFQWPSAVVAAAIVAALLLPARALATAALAWAPPASIDSGQTLNAVSCPSRTLCVAVDAAGHVLASGSSQTGGLAQSGGLPQTGGSSWRQVGSDPSHALTSVSCPSEGLCAAVDEAGRVLVSTSPETIGSWSPARSIDGTTALSAISCPSESLCVAVDQAGRALASTRPASAAQPWIASSIDSSRALSSVSCASAQLCVAVDTAGAALASSEPAGPAGSWRRREIDRPLPLTGVSCAAGLCVAVDGSGAAFASADPASATPTWSTTGIDTHALSGVSCASSGLCVTVDGGEHPAGEALASDNAGTALPVWSASRADPGVGLRGISCNGEGFCEAIAEGGRVIAGSVPPPEASTAAPVEIGPTTATLTGSVDANDAQLDDCRFEYGTTTAYGQSVPCTYSPAPGSPSPAPGSLLPAPGSQPQAVSAAVAGLDPATVYHYRLVAHSGAGGALGADESFATASATLVHPHPYISGVPAVGARLMCNSGLPQGSGATLGYAWRRDDSAIAGAAGAAYRVARADATHHLQCLVTATNAAGSFTAHSAFVAVPAQGVVFAVGETSVGRARAIGARVSVPVRCSPRAAGACAIALRLSTVRSVRHRRVRLTIGALGARLRRGQRRTLSVPLNALGRRMLSRSRRMSAQLSVSGTVIGVLRASLSRQRVVFAGGRS